MSQLKPRLLIADDESKYVHSLRLILEHKGYEVLTAADGQLALELAGREGPALILLDVRIPQGDGYAICRRIREFSLAPILMVTALGHETDIGTGLEAGADDYLVKPYKIEVLLARLETFLLWSDPSRPQPGVESFAAATFQVGDLRVDLARRQVWISRRGGGPPAEREVPLTAAEYRLLAELANAAGRCVPEAALLHTLWGADRMGAGQFVPIFIRRLRHKIEANPAAPQYILSQPDQGYSLGPATVDF